MVTLSGNRIIEKSRSDMAMFTMKKLIGLLMFFVLSTIIPITMLPPTETTNDRQRAKVSPIFFAEGSKQLDVLTKAWEPFSFKLKFGNIF